jgi:short-subunit dehydrogenase
LAGQVAVVTGASSGIGQALAWRLAQAGCRVGLVARRRGPLEDLAGRIRRGGGAAAVAVADVGQWDQVREAVGRVEADLGPVDLLVANAGLGLPTLCAPINQAEQEAMVRVNLLGVIYACWAVLPGMLRRGRGHLAAVSSLAADKGLPGEAVYCATKAAVNTYLEGLRIQLRPRGVRVTTICPGFVRTPMTADNTFFTPWMLEADEAAARIVRALAAGKRVYRFPWQTSWLVRLVRLLPDWVLARTMTDYNHAMAARPGDGERQEAA